MIPSFPQAMPVEGFIGGLMIGLAAAIMLLGLGRIAGVNGLTARAIGLTDGGAPRGEAAAFVVGLPLGAFLVAQVLGGVSADFPTIGPLILGGLIVGYGTRLGSGCTSGHGVCGVSRLSPRSLLATAAFMGSGFLTVGVMRIMGWL